MPPPSEVPCHSSRIAGMGVESHEACPAHLKKMVMRALDMDVQLDREQLDQKILEDYAFDFVNPYQCLILEPWLLSSARLTRMRML